MADWFLASFLARVVICCGGVVSPAHAARLARLRLISVWLPGRVTWRQVMGLEACRDGF